MTRKKHLDTFGILWYMLHHVASCWVDGGFAQTSFVFVGFGGRGGVGGWGVITF